MLCLIVVLDSGQKLTGALPGGFGEPAASGDDFHGVKLYIIFHSVAFGELKQLLLNVKKSITGIPDGLAPSLP